MKPCRQELQSRRHIEGSCQVETVWMGNLKVPHRQEVQIGNYVDGSCKVETMYEVENHVARRSRKVM